MYPGRYKKSPAVYLREISFPDYFITQLALLLPLRLPVPEPLPLQGSW
jgi:hypothetical protein